MTTSLSPQLSLDPNYVQISRKEAAKVLGRSIADFDRLRKADPDFPQAYPTGPLRNSPIRFRLADIYSYSEQLMQRSAEQ